jgi:hypothetical protein
LRARCRSRLWLAVRVPRSAVTNCGPLYFRIGISPNRIPERIDAAAAKSNHHGVDRDLLEARQRFGA